MGLYFAAVGQDDQDQRAAQALEDHRAKHRRRPGTPAVTSDDTTVRGHAQPVDPDPDYL